MAMFEATFKGTDTKGPIVEAVIRFNHDGPIDAADEWIMEWGETVIPGLDCDELYEVL